MLRKIYDEKVIKWFYILLPLIEVITTYMVLNVKTSITVGMVYKTLFLLYAIVYLIFIDKINKKYNFILLGIFFVSIVANVICTIDNISLKIIITKLVSISKYVCFPISLMFLYKYYLNGNKVGLKTLVYSAMIYATVMIVARLTGTQLSTYDTNDDWGHTGWFYSGNEISALMSMFYPITIYFCSKYESKLLKYSLIAVTYGLLTIGTKTSFMAIFISIISILIFEIIMFFIKKERISMEMLFTTVMLLIVVLASAPYSPSMKFIADRFEKAKTNVSEDVGENNTKLVYKTFVFNGRETFIKNQSREYKKAPLVQKVFGMSDSRRIKTDDGMQGVVERDLYDILFTYGIFGFIVYFTPMIIILVKFAVKLFSNFKEECNEKNFIMGISIMLSMGISYIAGHVLLAPTVALFLSVVFSKLNYQVDNGIEEEK